MKGLRVAAIGAVILLTSVVGPFLAVAAQNGLKRVLVLQATRRDSPSALKIEDTVHRALSEALGGRLDYHSEYIDLMRFEDASYVSALREYLRARYSGVRFDVIVVSSSSMIDFVRQSDPLFADTPIVFGSGVSGTVAPNTTGLASTIDFTGTIDAALGIQPMARQVFVITGESEFDRFYERLARSQFDAYTPRLTFTYLTGLGLEELEARVRSLPSNAFVYYLSVSVDGGGQSFVPMDVLDRIAAAASVPTYSWIDTALGRGIVGGRLRPSERRAGELAGLALRILNGERADTIPVAQGEASSYQFDWRQLRRWGFEGARLPAGSIVLFREPTAWDRYWRYIVGALSLLVFQTVLIAGLLIQRTRRRRAEGLLKAKEAALRSSYEEVRLLMAKLLTAQESERARIARDLHDDLAQDMATLSLEVGALKLDPAVVRNRDLQGAVVSLQQRCAAVAEGIRDLSHDLHPQALQSQGLVDAIASHCHEVRHRSGLLVDLTIGDEVDEPAPEVALCLYRTAQEALRNVVRHARAGRSQVSLFRVGDRLELTIADDGAGFDPAQARASTGLGLVSIDERVRIVRGSVSIDTKPGRGTTVWVQVPMGEGQNLRAPAIPQDRRPAEVA